MTPIIADPVELREKGFAAIVDSLGWVNAVRFIQQYEQGAGNYTAEREQLLPELSAEELVRAAREIDQRTTN